MRGTANEVDKSQWTVAIGMLKKCPEVDLGGFFVDMWFFQLVIVGCGCARVPFLLVATLLHGVFL